MGGPIPFFPDPTSTLPPSRLRWLEYHQPHYNDFTVSFLPHLAGKNEAAGRTREDLVSYFVRTDPTYAKLRTFNLWNFLEGMRAQDLFRVCQKSGLKVHNDKSSCLIVLTQALERDGFSCTRPKVNSKGEYRTKKVNSKGEYCTRPKKVNLKGKYEGGFSISAKLGLGYLAILGSGDEDEPLNLDPYLDAIILPRNCNLHIRTTRHHGRTIKISDGRVRMVFKSILNVCQSPMTQGEIDDTREWRTYNEGEVDWPQDEKDWLVTHGEKFYRDSWFIEFLVDHAVDPTGCTYDVDYDI